MDASFRIVVFWTLAILETVGASPVFCFFGCETFGSK